MKTAYGLTGLLAGGMLLLSASSARAQDWPQWRGTNREARVTGFTAPATWPKELKQQWKIPVGSGVASPALVGDKLYVFTHEGKDDFVRCLDAASGKELWKDLNEASVVTGIASGGGSFAGPRSSPTVAEGKVVTLGARGVLSCFDAATGKVLWRKVDFKDKVPMFSAASSPMIVDGLCIAQLGVGSSGGIVAYDLTSGAEKWKWTGDGPAYASPSLLNVGGQKMLVAETDKKIVALNVADAKQVWETAYAVERGRGRGYNAASPMVEGQTILYSGSNRGVKAVKIEKKGDEIAAKDLWSNTENSPQFNTPVVKGGYIYALNGSDKLFCINAETGKTAWTGPTLGSKGYGSIVDVGPVLMALSPKSELVVFEPSDKEFKEIAKYKVADGEVYAYPIVAGKRIYVKDKDSLYLWTLE
jgi:outer membrane protein assembly factor BamB